MKPRVKVTSILIIGGDEEIQTAIQRHYESLNGKCELCGTETRLIFDHEYEYPEGCDLDYPCYNCGEARGYLCRMCKKYTVVGADEAIRRGNSELVSDRVLDYVNDSKLRWQHIMCHPKRKHVDKGYDPLGMLP